MILLLLVSRVVVSYWLVVDCDAGIVTVHMVVVVDFDWYIVDIVGMNKLLVVVDMRKKIGWLELIWCK